MDRPSVFEYAGGDAAFLRLAGAHHARCLADPVLEHPFSHGVHPEHVPRLAGYWAEVFGRPGSTLSHAAMLALHAGTGADDDLGERFVACFLGAVDDAGLPDDAALRGVLHDYIRAAVAQVMAVSPVGADVPPDLPAPRWTWDGPVGQPAPGTT